jgi:hypothetical protein
VSAPATPRRHGFLRDGGWILVAAVALAVVIAAWQVAPVLLHPRAAAVGDGRTVASYRFDLTRAIVPLASIVASGAVKDGVPALTTPAVWTLADLEAAARRRRGKLLVAGDRVVGVALGGQQRAYPLRFLVWHEVVDDTLGGEPIAVTYSPLSDSVVVFRRTLAGRTVDLGVSGLLYQSSLLMYDRRPGAAGESLWSQLLSRAIAGPAAGSPLQVVPCTVTTWDEWRSAHAGTTLLAPDSQLAAEYAREPFGSYFGSDLLRFPVAPLPPAGGPALKTPLVAVRTSVGYAAITLPALARLAGATGSWSTEVDGRRLEFHYRARPGTVSVTDASGAPAADCYAFYFAWYAIHHADTTWLAEPNPRLPAS